MVGQSERQDDVRACLALQVDGQYSQKVFDQQRRNVEDELARVDADRERLMARMEGTTERLERMQALKETLARFASHLAETEDSFASRRKLVEVLDVVIHLRFDGKRRRAYLLIEGEHLATVELPLSGQRRKRLADCLPLTLTL